MKNIVWYEDEQIKRTMAALEKNNMKAYRISSREALIELLNDLIPTGSRVGVGDSLTLEQTGVLDHLRQGPFEFLDKYKKGLTKQEKKEIYRQNFSADTFISSTNALTEKGDLLNIDGNGSRVAPMIYGPDQVLIITGKNKIVRNMDQAIERVRQYAAPIDAKRLGKNTPCCKLGYCVDCKSPERICNSFVTISRQFDKNRIKVIILDDILGY